jgi:hypothetical protein
VIATTAKAIRDSAIADYTIGSPVLVPGSHSNGKLFTKGVMAMAKLGILGLAGLALAMLAVDAAAQRGGAARGGVRGAVVGEMVGGESGAQAGAVIGATRGAANRAGMVAETQARAQYATTPAYMTAQHSNFTQAPPQVLVASPATGTPATGTAAKGGEAVLRTNGKPVAAITYPDDWKQQATDNHVSAVSKDGQAWSVIAIIDGVKDQQAGMEKAKQGLEKSLKEVKYDEPIKTKSGALAVTGTGKTMKSDINVVFAAGVLEAAPGQFVGLAFVVDDNVDEHYKETARYICQTIRFAKDLAK